MSGAVYLLNRFNVLFLPLLCANLFSSVMVTELPPIWGRAANSNCHLYFYFKICCVSFCLGEKLSVLIRSVSEVSLIN